MIPDRIVAIGFDPGAFFGWSVVSLLPRASLPLMVSSGTISLPPATAGWPARLAALAECVREILRGVGAGAHICYYDLGHMGPARPSTTACQVRCQAVAELMCYGAGVPANGIRPAELAREITGRGVPDKAAYIAAAELIAGRTVNSEDEADAICLAYVALKHLTAGLTIEGGRVSLCVPSLGAPASSPGLPTPEPPPETGRSVNKRR